MDSPPPVRRPQSDDWSPLRSSYFSPRNLSNESLGTPNDIPLRSERSFHQPSDKDNVSGDELGIEYGEGPIPAPRVPRSPRRARQASRTSNASSRPRLPPDNASILTTHMVPELNEGLETDGRRAEEVEQGGLSYTVTLPIDNEQTPAYTNLAETNSVWKAEKSCDRRIGTTTLQSIYSIQYSIGERGTPKLTLFCPQGPARDEDASSVQARWLHVERPSMSIKVLEKLVMDCTLINRDIQRVAILLLEAVRETFLRHSENGAYVEPGSAMRFVGQRHQLHDSHGIVVTDPVVFVAFPFVELDSSRNHSGSGERDEYHPRTLLQNLYGFDVLTSRGKQQVIHKMSASRHSSETLYVNQLWCLLIGSDILITMSNRPADELLGETIEKRTDFFRQPLRIQIVDTHGSQYGMSISLKTTWVDFFRHVMFTIYGNLTRIMDYELVDEANVVVTAERWVEIAKSTRSALLRFRLVGRRITTSRASSVSSRKSSRTGIRKLLTLDQPNPDTSRGSSRRRRESYDEDSASSESSIALRKPSKLSWPASPRSRASLFNHPTSQEPVREKRLHDGMESERYTQAIVPGHGAQSTPTVITLGSTDEQESRNEKATSAMTDSQQLEEKAEERREPHENELSRQDQSTLMLRQLPPESDAEETKTTDDRASAVQLEEGTSQLLAENDQAASQEPSKETVHTLPMKDSKGSGQRRGVQIVVDDSMESRSPSASQSGKPSPAYRKVTIEDESEAELYDAESDSWLYEFIEADFTDDEMLKDKAESADQPRSQFRPTRAKTPHKGHASSYHDDTRRNSSHRRFRSRSRSSSNSTDDSFQSRGRSRTQRRRISRRNDTHSSRASSSWRGVRFDSNSQHPSERNSLEMSPYGSSNATKVEASEAKAVAVPFFCWRQSGVAIAGSSPEITDQRVIKILDHIDELICDDQLRKYYSKVAEFTMDDVILRQECLHEAILVNSSVNEKVGAGEFGGIDGQRRNAPAALGNYSSDFQALLKTSVKSDDDAGVHGLGVGVNSPPSPNTGGIGEPATPDHAARRDSTDTAPSRRSEENTQSNQTQALGLISHDKTLVKQLVAMSQQIIWSFIPNAGGSVIHTLMKRLWGCVDLMCLQLLWEENERGQDDERTYIVRNFSSQMKEYNSRTKEPSLGKTHHLECDDCKAAKPYSSAEDALKHIHEKHIECLHSDAARPYDDPCYAWLHRIWHDGYPMRSSQDGLLDIVEDFIEELADISMYVRDLLNMTARDSSAGDTPPLSANIIHIFHEIVKIYVFRSKQLSLINRRRSLAAEGPQENIRLIQRIDRKMEELLSLEIDANEHIIDLSESAKKDIFMSGIGSHTEIPQAETVRAQFLALALISGVQRPLLQSSYIGRSYTKDTLLQLYRDYTSRLHFQANNRPRKRVFLDIHGLEEELQALDKLLGSQESCLYNALTLIDPLTSRYTTETRLREFRAELQYGNDQLRGIIDRRREIENLATRLRILKDQVKQTIEIMEEDHGKAIRVFTVVTLFFLPLSFVSSFLGMNTVDVRDTEYSQRIFWMTGVPVTVAVLSVAFIYGYKGEEILDGISHLLQNRRRRNPSLGENRDNGYRTPLGAGWREWNPATTTKQYTVHRRRLTTFMRGQPNDPHDDIENIQTHDADGKVWVERRNTDDSLAPIRRRI